MKGEWRGHLFSDISVCLHVFFFPTLSKATVAATPRSSIQGVRYKEEVGSANLSHAGSHYTEGYFQTITRQRLRDRGHQMPDYFSHFIPSKVVKEKK